MNKQQIIDAIKSLSSHQGYYSRLYSILLDNEEYLTYLESQKFRDIVDMIMFLEEN